MSPPENILIFRLGSLGDTLVALPCFNLIRRAYPNRQIFLLTNEPISQKAAPAMTILQDGGLCDHAIAYPAKTRDSKKLSALRKEIKSHRFETVIHLFTNRGWARSWRDCLFFRSCGIKHIIGTPPVFPSKTSYTTKPMVEQQSLGLVRKLRRIGDVDIREPSAWDLHLRPEERELAASLLAENEMAGSFIVASIGTKAPAKDWGDENWQRVFELLSKARPGLKLALMGSADEFERSQNIRQFWHGSSANLCGKSEPRISAAVLERASLFVGHDSGPMHLAAAAGIPVVAVFSWHNPPGQWYPGCSEWKHIKIFYPPLPGGVWRPELRLRRSQSEGILLIQPEPVAEACLSLIPTGRQDEIH
jgi:ADP-heptose:LPS heptosyltransferase